MKAKTKVVKGLKLVAGFLVMALILLVFSNPPIIDKDPKTRKMIKNIVKAMSLK